MKFSKLPLAALVLLGTLAGCQGGSETSEVKLLDLGSEFNERYYPDLDSINKELAGKITIALVFDGKEAGWKAVAEEYEKLHEGAVSISINSDYNAETYPDKVKHILADGNQNPEWHIIQGNLLGGLSKETYTVSLNNQFAARNPYAGNKPWKDFLTADARDPANTYILNSENLQTAWFVNLPALNAAIAKGYQTEEGTTGYPKTWNDLKLLCAKMVEAGYQYPLGLSLDKQSINASQFSWLLRIYGDFYYRNEYPRITDNNKYVYDPTDKAPENGFTYSVTRFFHSILDDSDHDKYVGVLSDKFEEFLNQFYAIRSYISPFSSGTSFSNLRNSFMSQTATNTKESPQIMIDYVGSGLGFVNKKSDVFEVDFFDNPRMESAGGFIDPNTLLRDVGGNGGYLSVARHKSDESDKISTDFLKFFMSPYGQTIYYNTLAKTNLYPQGLTTVNKNLVVIPEAWKTFFDTEEKGVVFSGQSDKNDYVSFLIRYMSTIGTKTNDNAKTYWSSLLNSNSSAFTVADFKSRWYADLFTDWQNDYAPSQNYDPNCYLHPGEDPFGPYNS